MAHTFPNVQFLGSNVIPGRTWAPIPIYSGIDDAAEDYGLDPVLPPLGSDPLGLSFNQIVIPKGRIVSLKQNAYTVAGQTLVTVANGVSNVPMGFAPYNLLRHASTGVPTQISISRNKLIGVPYISGVNDAYGSVLPGMAVTAYAGSATSTSVVAPEHVGKIVKWIAKTTYSTTIVASTGAALTSANLASITPVIVLALNASGVAVTGGTLAWNAGTSKWDASFTAAVVSVIYTFGQNADQKCGQAVRVQQIADMAGWLDKVQDDYGSWDVPPMWMRVPTAAITNEAVTLSSGSGTLANKPLAGWKSIVVTITGTVIDPSDGSSTSVTGGILARADVADGNYCHGMYYDINPATGVLTFSSNVTVTGSTNCTVSYEYQTGYRNGREWFPGMQGITDGTNTGIVGTPAHLNYASLLGELRVQIF